MVGGNKRDRNAAAANGPEKPSSYLFPHMIAQHSGHIINMSSIAGWISAPKYSVYSASKFGVRGFTDALRREVGIYGVHVSGIYPGPAYTEFSLHTGKKSEHKWYSSLTHMTSAYVARRVVDVAKHPRRRLIIPWWFAPAIWADDRLRWLVDWVVSISMARKNRN